MTFISLGTLSKACQSKDLNLVNMALNCGAKPDPQTLTVACHTGNQEIVTAVVRAGAKPDEHTLTVACMTHSLAIVKLALAQGAKANDHTEKEAHASNDPQVIAAVKGNHSAKTPPAVKTNDAALANRFLNLQSLFDKDSSSGVPKPKLFQPQNVTSDNNIKTFNLALAEAMKDPVPKPKLFQPQNVTSDNNIKAFNLALAEAMKDPRITPGPKK